MSNEQADQAAIEKANAAAAAKAEKEAAKEAAAQAKAEAKAKRDAEAAAAKEAKKQAAEEAKAAKAAAAAEAKAKKDAEVAAKAEEKAAAAAAKAAEKAAAAEAKVKVVMPSKNGITRPRPDGACGKVWAIADAMSSELKQPVPISMLSPKCAEAGLNDATTRTQYARWKQFNGVFGPVAKPAVAQDAAAA